MSILSNNYKSKPWLRPFILGVVVAGLTAAGASWVAPLAVPLIHEALCGDRVDCSISIPKPTEIPIPSKK